MTPAREPTAREQRLGDKLIAALTAYTAEIKAAVYLLDEDTLVEAFEADLTAWEQQRIADVPLAAQLHAVGRLAGRLADVAHERGDPRAARLDSVVVSSMRIRDALASHLVRHERRHGNP